ncbi:feruloyl esterase a [Ophiocordyceps camponoti-floridani]|uniref:Feruloyl esterase a n=1 Tax=Ophiocordyceps camponoti-floridani TaxID=2030778 RepID=A0A8H4Q8F7_9HYPO|nr:feruloyl esterase a [Ophiocordyceps camponoti-floridani]
MLWNTSKLSLIFTLAAAALTAADKKPKDTLDRLKRYSLLCAISYLDDCPRPPSGITIAHRFDNNATGIIFKDANNKEMVVAFRGTTNFRDIATDANFLVQSDFESPGISGCEGCKVHAGFLESWNTVAKDVISNLQGQLAENPDMKVVVTGHSLGGAQASLAAMSIIGSGLDADVVTFGQPRTGNQAYADFVDEMAPDLIRVTHADDIVPQIPPKDLASSGYQHHSTEVWQEKDADAATTFQCEGQEPKDCNLSVKSQAKVPILGLPNVNLIGNISLGELASGSVAHGNYMGVPMGTFADGRSCGKAGNVLGQLTEGLTNILKGPSKPASKDN